MPLTAEEMKQRKMEKKAQKLREADELRRKSKKDELERDMKNSRANMAAYMKQWYTRNYVARFPHVKQEMEVAWHSFEHTLDVKDFIISQLQDRLEETKIQEGMSWQDYALKIDHMISDHQKRIENLDSEYQASLKKLIDEALKMAMLQGKEQEDLEDYYKTILFIMEERFLEATNLAQGEYVTKRDEEAKKGAHNIEAMSAALEKSLQMTMTKIKDTLQEYKDETEPRKKELEGLKAKDDYYMDMIKRQDTRMAKLCEELSDYQSQVNERHESKLVLEDLKKDREETYTEYTEVRARLTRETTTDNDQLLTLCTESNNMLQDLERIVEKGEKILRLGALCRRLETQEEKVLPFGLQVQLKADEHSDWDLCSPLSLFWRRYAHANLVKRKLEPTVCALYNENEELKKCLDTTFEIMAMLKGAH